MDLVPLAADPDVAVVIPARNDAPTLPAAVRSALDQHVPAGIEVVVAVGPSDDDTADVAANLAEADGRVRVVANPAGYTPQALNAAIAASTGEVVVRLDAHAVLPPGYIAAAVARMRETNAANVGGRQVPTADAGFAAAVAAAMRSRVGSGGAAYRVGGAPGEAETVYLGVFRRAALTAVGGFDETLVRNQDYELNHRLRAAGGRVFFDPALGVSYTPRGTPRALWRQYHSYGAWKRHVMRRFPASIRARQLAAPVLVLGLALGVVAATTWSWAPLATLVGSWAVVIVVGAAMATPRPSMVPMVALALAEMHIAWGVGFLTGRAAP